MTAKRRSGKPFVAAHQPSRQSAGHAWPAKAGAGKNSCSRTTPGGGGDAPALRVRAASICIA